MSEEKRIIPFSEAVETIRSDLQKLYENPYRNKTIKGYPMDGSALNYEPFLSGYDKEKIEKLYLAIIVKRSKIDFVLNKFIDGLKPGEFGRFSGSEPIFVFDSCADIKEEKLTVKSLKQRKLEENLENAILSSRQLGKTETTKMLLERTLDSFYYEPVLTQDDFEEEKNIKAEFKKSPLERLNKKKAVKTANVSPLLKGLIGKT